MAGLGKTTWDDNGNKDLRPTQLSGLIWGDMIGKPASPSCRPFLLRTTSTGRKREKVACPPPAKVDIGSSCHTKYGTLLSLTPGTCSRLEGLSNQFMLIRQDRRRAVDKTMNVQLARLLRDRALGITSRPLHSHLGWTPALASIFFFFPYLSSPIPHTQLIYC